MRPSKADTSEPAWLNRKILSMKSSVSAPVESRNHSAIVKRRQGDPQPGARRLVHLAEAHDRAVDDRLARAADLGLLHFQPEIVPFAGALADPGEHREAAVHRGDAGDQLGEDDRLAQPGAAEQADLAAADERG